MCEDGWPLRAAEGAVDDVIAVELLPLVHGLTAAPAEVAVAVEGHEPFLGRARKGAGAGVGWRSLPAGHGVTRRLRSGGRAAASAWSWSVRPAVAARGVRPDLVERMVMLVSVADDDGVAVLAVAPGGHDCAGMPSAYDARAIAVLAPGNDYPVTDAGHASRHQWLGCSVPRWGITPPDVRYAPHCPFPGRCQGVLSLTTFSGDVGLASSHGAIASWRRVISPPS